MLPSLLERERNIVLGIGSCFIESKCGVQKVVTLVVVKYNIIAIHTVC